MKKLGLFGIIISAGLLLASLPQTAYGLPSIGEVTGTKVESYAKDAVKMGIILDLNKYLSGQGCTCNPDGSVSGCDLNAIGKKVRASKAALNVALNRNVHFYAKSKSIDCNNYILDKVGTGSWTWYWNTHKNSKVKMWVD